MKYGERAIKKAKLELWDNPSPDRDYEISFSFPEFARLCSGSGLGQVGYESDRQLYANTARGLQQSDEVNSSPQWHIVTA